MPSPALSSALERAAALLRKADDKAWRTRVYPAMQAGAVLERPARATLWYTRHRRDDLSHRGGLQDSFVRGLVKAGALTAAADGTFHLSSMAEVATPCRGCGCADWMACVDSDTGQRCHWVEPDLCSACAEQMEKVR